MPPLCSADHSAYLTKRFAALTLGYLDAGTINGEQVAHVPLENLFRLLEMLRYGAFIDGRNDGWHVKVEAGLRLAVSAAYTNVTEAIDDVEAGLRALALAAPLDAARTARCRAFMARLESAL